MFASITWGLPLEAINGLASNVTQCSGNGYLRDNRHGMGQLGFPAAYPSQFSASLLTRQIPTELSVHLREESASLFPYNVGKSWYTSLMLID